MIPNRLKKGDIIAVIAPSNHVQEDDIPYLKKTEEMFLKKGIHVIYGKNIMSNTLGYGGTPMEKAEDLNAAFGNKKVQAIFCAKGGENSNALFEFIDYELVQKNPKIFCGFSDSTFLMDMIYEKTGLTTFYASTFKAISDWDSPSVFENIIQRLMEENTHLIGEDEKVETIQKGTCEGTLMGGNLNCLREMVCGKYAIDFRDKILFIEDMGEESNPKFISNFLYYMKQNDVFAKIKGLWIGSYKHESGIKLEKIVKDVLGKQYNFPMIQSENFGHIPKKQVIPVGVKAKIDTSKEEKVVLLEKCVK